MQPVCVVCSVMPSNSENIFLNCTGFACWIVFFFLFRFSRDIRNVIKQAEVVGIKQMILTGNTLQMSQSAVLQAKAHPRVLYASVGVHPHFTTKEWNEKTAKEIEELAKDPVVVSIGEVGLDFHRNYSDEKAQIEAFTKQVLPLI